MTFVEHNVTQYALLPFGDYVNLCAEVRSPCDTCQSCVTALLQRHNFQGSAQLSKAKPCFLEHDKIYLARTSASVRSCMFSKAAVSGNAHTLSSRPASAPSYPSSVVAVEEAADWRVDASGAAGAVFGWGQYRSMTRRVPPPCRVPTWGLRVRSDPGGALNSKV